MDRITPPIGEPMFYQYIDHLSLSTTLFDICHPYIASEIVLIKFEIGDLSDPKSEPIVIYFNNGNRQYIWKNIIWNEVDLSGQYHKIKTDKNGRYYPENVYWVNSLRSSGVSLSLVSQIINHQSKYTVFVRSIYKVGAWPI